MVQESIKNGERLAPHLRELNKSVILIKGRIENGCRSGQISIEDYLQMLETL